MTETERGQYGKRRRFRARVDVGGGAHVNVIWFFWKPVQAYRELTTGETTRLEELRLGEEREMTKLDKVLKRELDIEGEAYVLAIAPEGLKLTVKGKRNGQELLWKDLVSGQAALSTALNATLEQVNSRPETGFASLAAGLSAAGRWQQVDSVDSRRTSVAKPD